MRKNKSMKKILSLLFAFVLTFNSINVIPLQAETNNDPSSYGYKQVTLADDFGIVDGTYTKASVGAVQKYATYTGTTLDKTYLDVNLTLKSGANMKYGGVNPDRGLQVWVASGKLYLCGALGDYTSYSLNPSDFDLTTFENTAFRLWCSFEYVAADSDNQANDAKVGIWINGIFADFYTVKDCVGVSTGFGKYVSFLVNDDNKSVTVSSPKEPTPENYGYVPVTLAKDFSIADGTYTKANVGSIQKYATYTGDTLSGKYLDVTLTLKSNAVMKFGGVNPDHGLQVGISNGRLYINDTVKYAQCFISPSEFDMTTFDNTAFRLWCSIEYVSADTDGEKNDAKVGIWINGKLDKFYTFKDSVVGTTGFGKYVSFLLNDDNKSVTVSSPADPIPENCNYEKVTLADDFGIADGTYTKANVGSIQKYATYTGDTLSGKYLDVNLTLKSNAIMKFGGVNPDHGLQVGVSNGRLYINDTVKYAQYFISPSRFDMTTFDSTAFRLWCSIEYISADVDGIVNDAKVGIWINETFADFYIFKDSVLGTTGFGKYVSFLLNDDNKTVIVSTPQVQPEEVVTPETYGYEQVTFMKHFGINNGTYTKANVGSVQKYATYTGESLDGTYLNVNLTLKSGANMKYAGVNPDRGLQFWVASGKLYICDTTNWKEKAIEPSKFSLTTFENTAFQLWCSLEYIAADADEQKNDAKVGIWINGVFDQFYTMKDCVGVDTGLGKYVSFTLDNDQKSVTIQSPLELSYNHYGVACQTVETETVQGITQEGSTILNGIFYGDVQFPENDAATYLNVGGMNISYADEGLCLKLEDEEIQITETEANRTLAGTMLSMKLVFSAAGNNDVKVSVYVDDELCKEHIFSDKANLLDNILEVHSDTEPIIVGHASEKMDESLTKITFSKFGIPDGTYSVDTVKGIAVSGEYKDSLDGTVFSGNVCFSDTPKVWLNYGGTGEWSGLRFKSNGNGTLSIERTSNAFNLITFDSDIAGVKLTESEYNLQISLQYVDSDEDDATDDVKLGVWFNGMLYNNEYIYIQDLVPELGSYLGIYTDNENSTLKVSSVDLGEKQETLDESLKTITLKNFRVKDGKYSYTKAGTGTKGAEASGGYAFTLDGTVFSANVKFSSEGGAELRYGGGTSMWAGLVFVVMNDGRIRMNDASYNPEEGDKLYYFDSGLAGVELTDNMFNLKLSTEYVDSDGDGAKDDVKFGVWFNDVLYNNEYIYFTDYALEMGSNLTILSRENAPKSYLYIKSDTSVYTGVDFSIYGFTKNWDKELGERR